MTTAASVSSVVTSRYATAIIDLADKEKVLDKVEKDLSELQSMISESEDLRSFIKNPLIAKQVQSETIAALSSKAKFQKLTINFLNVLIQNKRLNALPQVLRAVKEAFAKRRGEKFALVTVAQDLTAVQRADLEKSLAKAAGAAVALDIKVDPAIIGGMIVTIDSKMIDDSVARKLDKLKMAMGREANQNTNQNLSEVS